jgi:protein gp37
LPETTIEWCDFTFNCWYGCTKVSPGCDHCFAEAWAKRSGLVEWGNHPRKRTSDKYWREPLKWAKTARTAQEMWKTSSLAPAHPFAYRRPRVFCASLADVFDNQVDPVWRVDLFDLIHQTPELDWLLLTKRPENIKKMGMLPGSWLFEGMAWPNVWLGFSAENQEMFDRRWAIVREIPAAIRFCSYEPALGPLRWSDVNVQGLDWLICGGESGRGHRLMHAKWEENIRQDCKHAGIAYFFKQLSGKRPIPNDFPLVRQFPSHQLKRKVLHGT